MRWLDTHGLGAGRFELLLCSDGRVLPWPESMSPPVGASRLGLLPELLPRDALLMPSAVDAHVHLREPGHIRKEGIINGTRAAAAGGVTFLLDMPNNVPPTTTAEGVKHKRALFRKKSLVRWGLFAEASPRNPFMQALFLRRAGCVGAKVYMAERPAFVDAERLAETFGAWRLLALHAELSWEFQKGNELLHHERRPRQGVLTALTVIEGAVSCLPLDMRPRLVLCHISTRDELEWLCSMRARGFDIWAETCPHYLLFTQDQLGEQGALLQVNPPLRELQDQVALLRAVADGTIDFVSSDHAPHMPSEKAAPFGAPSGIAGIEWTLPALMQFVEKGVLSWERLGALTRTGASRCYGLEGVFSSYVPPCSAPFPPSRWGDFTLLSRAGPPALPPVTRAGAGPYAGAALDWRVELSVVGGWPVFLGPGLAPLGQLLGAQAGPWSEPDLAGRIFRPPPPNVDLEFKV